MQRLELESEALDKRYEIFYGAEDDEVWMKRLFSPTFIVWLDRERRPRTSPSSSRPAASASTSRATATAPTELDALCEAAGEVAKRLAEEAAE